MKIIEIKIMHGPNYWSVYRHQLIVMQLDLQESCAYRTHQIDSFSTRLEALIPSLFEHRGALRKPGGFLEQVQDGIGLEYVVEHVALELQSLAGMPCGYGRIKPVGKSAVKHVIFSYQVASAGVYAAKAAVRIVQALASDIVYDIKPDILSLIEINRNEGLGPSTQSIINAALRMNIPYRRLDKSSTILLGYGARQKIIDATIAGTTSNIGVETAADKEHTKEILSENYIPTPEGKLVATLDQLKEAIATLKFPLVVKPLNGNHGRAVKTNINTPDEAIRAFYDAQLISENVVVERFIEGYDFRFLVINFKLEAVARRTAACVIGDGRSTIGALVLKKNSDPQRGEGHEKVMTRIEIDGVTHAILVKKNLTLDWILPQDEILFLKDSANLSKGGTATDITDLVHAENIFMAERIARLMNLDICGIDVIAKDITSPIVPDNGAVVEVNAAPGFRMHLSPSRGIPRDVGEPVIKMLFPPGTPSRIPLVAVTGTNGKTTTTRLIAHFAKYAGHVVGFTTTDGIYINGHLIHAGDCSGPSSAHIVLRDPLVEFAVLECARGGILRSGLGFDKCDIGIVTNITEDHLGLDGIHTLAELAQVKSVVPRSTSSDGTAILNADDDVVFALKDELACNLALFSMDADNPRIKTHCEEGGWAAVIDRGHFTILKGAWGVRVGKVYEVPLTQNGKAISMIKNVLPAILAAALSGFDIKIIRNALQEFLPGPEQTPGRMNIFEISNFKVMIDYAHNTDGFLQLKSFIQQIDATQKVGIIGCTGDRRDGDIVTMGRYAAEVFDQVIIRHDKDGRGRTNEEITSLILEGIHQVIPHKPYIIISDEMEALQYAVEHAVAGSFITDCTDEIAMVTDYLKGLASASMPGVAG